MRKIYFILFVVLLNLCTSSIVKAQSFTLVKDINPGTAASLQAMPWESISENGVLYMVADDGTHGQELWRSDGTDGGTYMLKELSTNPTNAANYLTNVNGTIYFHLYDPVQVKNQLWKSDGTQSGTVMIKSFDHIAQIGFPLKDLTNVNGTLYFTVGTLANGVELWKSDGTDAGTVMVKDIVAGIGSSTPIYLTNVNGTLYFTATDPVNGREVWKSDGTAAGTVMVKNINPGNANSDAHTFNYVNGVVVFFANNGGGNSELWKTDGTDAGTIRLSTVTGNQFELFGGVPVSKTAAGNSLFFGGITASGRELWKTDGTIAGTMMIKDINPSGNSEVRGLAIANGWMFFAANDGVHGHELWKSDGTESGTFIVKDTWPGASSGCRPITEVLHTVNGKVFFLGNDGTGEQPWRSDGTEAGTYMMQNFLLPSVLPERAATAGSKFFISTQGSTVGYELFVATIPNESVPLPLTIIDISARLVGNNGVVKWKTTHEENTSHFEIERSLDNHKFIVAGSVPTHNMTGVHDYSFTDPDITLLRTSVVYYRLKLVEQNSKVGYSKTFAINLSEDKAVVMLYPVPANDQATLMIALRRRENLTINILDINGRIVKQKRVSGNEGSNLISLETASLSSGTYTVMINGEMTNSSTQLLKQ